MFRKNDRMVDSDDDDNAPNLSSYDNPEVQTQRVPVDVGQLLAGPFSGFPEGRLDDDLFGKPLNRELLPRCRPSLDNGVADSHVDQDMGLVGATGPEDPSNTHPYQQAPILAATRLLGRVNFAFKGCSV